MFPSFVRSRTVSNFCRPGLSALYYEEPFQSWNMNTGFPACKHKPMKAKGAWPPYIVRCHPSSYASSVTSSTAVPEVVLPGIKLKRKLLSTHSTHILGGGGLFLDAVSS
jgi:hypothetical protein